MSQQRTQTPILIFSIIAVMAIIAVVLFMNRFNSKKTTTPTPQKPDLSLVVNGKHVDETPTGFTQSPEELVGHIKEIVLQVNESGDAQPLIDLIGLPNLTANQVRTLHHLSKNKQLTLDSTQPFSGKNNDWTLHLANKENIQLNLTQKANGEWEVNRVILPTKLPTKNKATAPKNKTASTQKNAPKDIDAATAQKVVESFLHALLNLNPSATNPYTDSQKVSYATLTGLCIIFEEGRYTLDSPKPIRKMFLNKNTAGWIVRLKSPDTNIKKVAMLGITTKRSNPDAPWKITEVNFDKLLSDYAARFSDGDIHYVPLVKNPQGGDSIVLYFELDSTRITQRTKQQLNIIANLLKNAPNKKLTISGYTDALGSDNYNLNLSARRAKQVMSYLASQGVNTGQMKLTSFGKANPRQPNTSEDGRRANRRAEILLNF